MRSSKSRSAASSDLVTISQGCEPIEPECGDKSCVSANAAVDPCKPVRQGRAPSRASAAAIGAQHVTVEEPGGVCDTGYCCGERIRWMSAVVDTPGTSGIVRTVPPRLDRKSTR